MKKTTRRYVITTSAVNSYGYRVLTTGIDLTQFQKNPVLFWMHKQQEQTLPLGLALDVRVEGDKITCALGFTENNAFAMQIYAMYEDGTLKMLSLGANPIEWTEDVKFRLPGQTGPTFTKTKANEVSCCDIGANDEALPVELYDDNGNLIQLSHGNVMETLKLAKTGKKPIFSTINHKSSTINVVTNAIAAGKLTEDLAHSLLSGGHDEESVNGILEYVKKAKINPDRLEGSIPKAILPMVNKSHYELENMAGNGMNLLREHAPEVYKAKFFEKHGRLPAERNGKPL
jgi:hypothetical protein